MPVFLLGFLFLFGVFTVRAVPVLPVLAERDIAAVPMQYLFTRADFLTHTAELAVESASTERRFMMRLRFLLEAEVSARKAVALRPIGSQAWHHRAYAALKSGRVSDAERYTLIALHDGPFSGRFAPSRLSLGLRFWDSLSPAEQQRHYALIRKAVYYDAPQPFVDGMIPLEEMVAHIRLAIGDDTRLNNHLARSLNSMGLKLPAARK